MKTTNKKFSIKVDAERCKGCNLCIEFCKKSVLKVSDNLNKMGYHYAEPDSSKECSGCMVCTMVCPDLAIEVYGE